MWLIHHGRKGQHWGELNGPPYPLDMTNKEYKKKQSEPEKSLVEKKYPKFAKAREKYLDYVEKHFPTGYEPHSPSILALSRALTIEEAICWPSLSVKYEFLIPTDVASRA